MRIISNFRDHDHYYEYVREADLWPYDAHETTIEMAKAFPELTRVHGYYHCPEFGKRGHWWLTDPDGNIVDPAISSLPPDEIGEHVPWRKGDPEPTPTCRHCGGVMYVHESYLYCDDKCEHAFMADSGPGIWPGTWPRKVQ